MKAILALFKLAQLTLYGKITLGMRVTFNIYKLYLKLKFSKMSDTEKIQEVLKPSIKLAVGVIKAYKDDNKIKLNEMIGLVPETLGVIKVIPNFKEALAELKDFDLDDAKSLVEFVKGLEDLDDTKAQIIIVNVIEMYEKLTDVYETNITPIIEVIK